VLLILLTLPSPAIGERGRVGAASVGTIWVVTNQSMIEQTYESGKRLKNLL
jgi:hypothetical protein